MLQTKLLTSQWLILTTLKDAPIKFSNVALTEIPPYLSQEYPTKFPSISLHIFLSVLNPVTSSALFTTYLLKVVFYQVSQSEVLKNRDKRGQFQITWNWKSAALQKQQWSHSDLLVILYFLKLSIHIHFILAISSIKLEKILNNKFFQALDLWKNINFNRKLLTILLSSALLCSRMPILMTTVFSQKECITLQLTNEYMSKNRTTRWLSNWALKVNGYNVYIVFLYW